MKKIVLLALALVLSIGAASELLAEGAYETRGADSSMMQGDASTRGAADMQTDSMMRGPGMAAAQGSRASQLLNKEVKNLQGEKLGKITDIVIDPARSRVGYVALQSDAADKIFAIPLQALTIDPATNAVTLDISKSKLQSAPSFAKNQWPDVTNTQWLSDVHRYYGLTPTW